MYNISEREQAAIEYFNNNDEELGRVVNPVDVIVATAKIMEMVESIEHPCSLRGQAARSYLRARAQMHRLNYALCALGLNPKCQLGFALPQYWEALIRLADQIEDEESIHAALTRLDLWCVVTL